MSTQTKDMVNAYANNQKTQLSEREIDAQALLRCASFLKAAIDEGATNYKGYGDAIRLNQRLWTLFQVALCDPDNALPRDLKILLLNLSRYIDQVSFRAVEKYAPHLLQSLIDINRTIAAGLSKKPAVSAAALQSQAMPQQEAVAVRTSA